MIRHLNFLLIALTVLVTSCTKLRPGEGETGDALLQIGLSVDGGVEIAPTKSEATYPAMDPSTIPSADDLYVELYRFGIRQDRPNSTKETWNRIYFGTYGEAKEQTLRVNAGDFRLLAFHGDSTACGFNKPFFFVQKEFVVEGGLNEAGEPNVTMIEADAKVSNVRIKVNFDESVSGSYYDYFVRFSNLDESMSKYKQILRYKKDETRDAYMMPTEQLQIEFMAQCEYADESSWKFKNLGTIAVAANDFLIVNLKVNPRNGNLSVNIQKDENIVQKDKEVEISEIWAPQDPPQVVAAGFPNNDHPVVEGDNTGNAATISVVARAGLRHFYLTLNSDYLTAAGIDVPLGVEMDLADPSTIPVGYVDKLKAAGLEWDENMKGSRALTYLKMTKLFEKINALNPSLTVERALAAFTIRVVDDVANETVKNLTATAYPIIQTLSIPVGNVWAKKIVSPTVNVERGVGRLFRLQVSSDGNQWSDFAGFSSFDNSVLDYGTLNVEPATKYYFRSVYNNNPNLISNVVEVVTESMLQIGNSGFEEYHSTKMHVSPMLDSQYDRTWYLPYNEGENNPWWAVNSKKTMPEKPSAQYQEYKNFPCTAFSTDAHSGVKSAMVYTVNVDFWNTTSTALGDNVPGEIWIGKADDSGNHTQDGHSFASRPSSVKFWYKYQPVSGETFVVDVILKDENGNIIAKSELLDGLMATEWTQCNMPIVYTNTNTKAASIYMCFKSCSSGSVNTSVTMEIGGVHQTTHIGAVLKIDDIELTY